jgi:peptidoglycan/LPS O-acetylase OafA/YrhL
MRVSVERGGVEEAREYFVFGAPVVRGACILAVIAIHVATKGEPQLWEGWLSPFSFAVPAFVLLSGFSLSLNERNETRPVGFYRRTLKFLVVAYLVYSAVYAVLAAHQHATLLDSFVFFSISGHLWFMPAVIGLYLLHPWLRRLYRRNPVATFVAAFALQLVVRPWIKAHAPTWSLAVIVFTWSSLVGYFVAGYVLFDRAVDVRRLCERWTGRLLSALIWSTYPVLTCLGVLSTGAGRIVGTASALAGFCLLASFGRSVSPAGRSLAQVVAPFGLYSFGTYLLHPIVLDLLSHVVTATGLGRAPVLWDVAAFSLTCPAALLVTRRLAVLPVGRYIT